MTHPTPHPAKCAEGKRDPRVDPKERDVVDDASGFNRLRVTRVVQEGKSIVVRYMLVSKGHPVMPTDRIPMNCSASLKDWRTICKMGEVIHAAK